MKRRIITSIKCLLSGVFFLSAMTAAQAQLNLTFASSQPTYTAGQVNNLTFTTTGGGTTGQWIDRLTLTFPAGFTINSATPNNATGCATNQAGNQAICSPSVSWRTNVGIPCGTAAFGGTGCGWWQNGALQTLSAMVDIPAGTSGPITVTLRGDGEFGGVQTLTVTLEQAIPPTPCVLTCPANMSFNLAPGACNQVVNYNVFTTGTCEIVQQACGFFGSFAPAAVQFWQVGGQAGAGFPPQGNSGSGPHVLFDDAGPACPAAFDRLTLRSVLQVGGFCFNGVQWAVGNALPTNIQFDWTYVQPVSAWDRFAVGIGSAAFNFSNSNLNFCNPPAGFWQFLTAQNIGAPSNQAGTFMTVLPANAYLALAAWTTVATGQPAATITITNFVSTQVVQSLPVQYAGLPSGATFPIGTTTNCFRVDLAPAGVSPNDPTCCFDVTVFEFPNPTNNLACNDLVYLSLDADCDYCLNADGVLEGGPYKCYDNYVVEVDKTLPYGNGPWVPACFNNSDVGKTYQVRVTDPATGNKCWGNIKIEDKLAPVLDCPSALLPCNFPTFAPDFVQTATFTLKFAAAAGELPKLLAPGQEFDFVIPVGVNAVVNDVDCRVRIDNALSWNASLTVFSPAATPCNFWQTLGGCTLTGPIFARFDDEGIVSALCVDIDADINLNIMQIFGFDQFNVFDGQNAQGDWVVKVRNADAFGFGNSLNVEIIELFINLTGDFTAGFPNGLSVGGPCGVQPLGNNSFRVPAGCGTPQLDNCSDVTLTYLDTNISDNCASGLTGHINRKWTATDASGNTSTCIQRINKLRPGLTDVIAPPDYDDIDAPAFNCSLPIPIVNGFPNPTPQWIEGQGLQGYPYVFGRADGCSINWQYTDYRIAVCDGTVKYRREWSIIDWCVGAGFIYNQIIKVLDEQGPSITCPANLTVSVNPFQCCATINLPDVIVTDNCSRINNISGMITVREQYTNEIINMVPIGGTLTDFPGNNWWDRDTMAAFGWTPCLPIGTHTVMYLVEDDCGNTTTCTFQLAVRDYIPPVAACDETTTIAIGVDDPFDCYGPAGPNGTPEALGACEFAGVTWVKASTFDDGSYDNCGNVYFTIRRMAPYSDCILGLNSVRGFLPCDSQFPTFPSEFERAISEYDSIKFYCCEVGTIQTVILRVYQVDVNGNIQVGPDGTPIFNECMIQVEVQDKLRPVCLPPANVTVNCENFDPSLWAYGKAQVYDNCCLDETREYQGQCGLTHTVNYSQFDTVCNRGTIVRTFRAFDCHGQSSQCTQRVVVTYNQNYYVRFPNDVIVTVCDGTGNYGEPTFWGEDCELLGMSFTDEIFTVVPDACYKIERTWQIINWCTYNPNLGCTFVPNPNPNAITNHPTNLPGPIVSPLGTLAPWAPTVVRINPTDPTTTNYSTFWSQNANCYQYKQIIKIIDGVAPTATYTEPTCANQNWLTPNNPQLWNEMYWWDNSIQSHDLCEEPTDLCITGTDACSGANINIEYLLFLDLDYDGIMETVVNSISTGLGGLGWNNVRYNNLNTPNFGGGTLRQFDGRPVPANQKWGFAIQETVSGNTKTACVRFNTQAQQNTFVAPQLPHGTHKIKWFITDGCGNNAEYEYTFTVRDCKPPTVVCLNGLSVNIMPTGMITLWASDFLQYTEDNCTPTNQIKIGIRKCGTGTGFPVDAQGNPITQVTFNCNELGTQCVELWAIDAQGNADYCETYLIVQDNLGGCSGGGAINVAGALKTEMQDGVEEGTVNVNGTATFLPNFSYFGLTSATGAYNFNNVPVASTFTIAPEKDDNPLNGVTTYDLVLISKHILGTEPFDSPYKMIAADANKSGSITTFDIVELRKLILGIYTELPNNTSWRFVDKSFAFPNANNPFQTAFPEVISVADAMANQNAKDFAGVKVGDVNNTAQANATMVADDRTVGTAIFDVEDREVRAGEEFEVSFKSAQELKGFQFTATLNGLTALGTVNAENVTENNFNLLPAGAMAVSIDGAQGFTVRFRADKAGKLSEMLGVSGSITRAEAYGQEGRMGVALRFGGKTISGVGFELYQNQPNPFVNKTFIGFYLPEAAEATLSVFDETGRVVYQQKGQFAKGENTISLDRALINTVGLLYYKLETSTDSATKKMIQAK